METRAFFIDLDGNVIENGKIESHIGLAIFIVDNDEKLKKEFEESGYYKQDLFLIEQVGYVLGYQKEYEKQLMVNKKIFTPEQKKTAFEFYDMGYDIDYYDNELTR